LSKTLKEIIKFILKL